MIKRQLKNYFGINTKSGHANNKFADRSKDGNLPQPKRKTFENSFINFFENNIIAWFIHDWRVKKRYDYPKEIYGSIYEMKNSKEQISPVRIALAADWATSTEQSFWVGNKIKEKKADYTIHLGDTYYSGKKEELELNFGESKNDGDWPRGKMGTFALCGNHEMFSSGNDYFSMITNPSRGFGINSSGQPAPVFCLKSEHWCILGLDTGFDSLNVGIFRLNPSNKALKFPDPVINWLTDVVKIQDEKRGIIVLTHHQYVSGFKNEDAFTEPAKQLKKLLGEKEIIWIWGHEHRFAIYGKYNLSPDHISAYGRCIGHGGMPAELIPKHLELSPDALSRKLILYDKRHATHVELIPENKETGEKAWVEPLGYNGYATIDIDDQKALITYYSAMKDSTNHVEIDQPTFNELWEADATTNTLQFLSATDLTVEKHLTYLHKPPNPLLVGQ